MQVRYGTREPGSESVADAQPTADTGQPRLEHGAAGAGSEVRWRVAGGPPASRSPPQVTLKCIENRSGALHCEEGSQGAYQPHLVMSAAFHELWYLFHNRVMAAPWLSLGWKTEMWVAVRCCWCSETRHMTRTTTFSRCSRPASVGSSKGCGLLFVPVHPHSRRVQANQSGVRRATQKCSARTLYVAVCDMAVHTWGNVPTDPVAGFVAAVRPYYHTRHYKLQSGTSSLPQMKFTVKLDPVKGMAAITECAAIFFERHMPSPATATATPADRLPDMKGFPQNVRLLLSPGSG